MKKVTILVFVLAIGFVAIARHKRHKNTRSGNEIISVTMHRTPCYGTCPDYTIKIDKDGTVTYTGIRFIPDTGVFTKNIGGNAMDIINQLNTYRPDTCRNLYRSRIQDMPGIGFTIQYADSIKQIFNAQFGPSYLSSLARKIDSTGKKTDNAGWQKVGK